MTRNPISALQQSILDIFAANPGIYLYYVRGPAATVTWSDERVEREWRSSHRQRPVAMNVAQALVNRGKLSAAIDASRRRIEYRLAT